MTDPASVHSPARSWSATAMRLGLAGLATAVLSMWLGGCGASNALSNAVLAPLSALPATDVVFETNLESAVEAGQTQVSLPGVSATGSANGVPETSGPPSSPGEVSVATATAVAVYTAYNPVDKHCLGTLVLSAGSPTVLGESLPGSYDFWFGPTTAANCAASQFTAQLAKPSGWASNDPSSTGWPSP